MKKYLAMFLLVILLSLIIFTGCENDSNSQNDSEIKEISLTAAASPTSLSSDCISSKDMIVDKTFEDWYVQQYGEIIIPEPKEELSVVFD